MQPNPPSCMLWYGFARLTSMHITDDTEIVAKQQLRVNINLCQELIKVAKLITSWI